MKREKLKGKMIANQAGTKKFLPPTHPFFWAAEIRRVKNKIGNFRHHTTETTMGNPI